MQAKNSDKMGETALSNSKFELFVIGSVFFLIAISVPYAIYQEASKLAIIKLFPAAIKVKSGSLALLSVLPTLFIFIWATIKRWKNRYTTNDANTLFKIIAFNFPIMLVVLFINKWYVADYLISHGYTPCRSYTSASIYASKVWVRQGEYCLKEASIVSVDLVDWAEKQARLGNVVTVEQLRNKAHELLESSPFKQ